MNPLKKEKYLRRSQKLQKKSVKPGKRLQATVEPFPHCTTTKESGTCATLPSRPDVPNSLTMSRTSSSLPQISRVSPVLRTGSRTSPTLNSTVRLADSLSMFSALNPDLSMTTGLVGPVYRHCATHNQEEERTLSSIPVHKEGVENGCTGSAPFLMTSGVESRVQVQMDINKELKRLLVASIGRDLQHRLNQIVQEKALASFNLDFSLKKLASNAEEIDRLSIACDIWRSKFLASRLMIDELAGWKANISQKLKESKRALQQLLQERLEIKRMLVECDHHLDEAGCANEKISSYQNQNVLDLAGVVLSKAILKKQNATNDYATSRRVEGVVSTNGERLAEQLLRNGDDDDARVHGNESMPLPLKEHLLQQTRANSKLSPSLSHFSLTHFFGTEHQSIHFHCSRCKGKIHHV